VLRLQKDKPLEREYHLFTETRDVPRGLNDAFSTVVVLIKLFAECEEHRHEGIRAGIELCCFCCVSLTGFVMMVMTAVMVKAMAFELRFLHYG